MDSYRTMIGRQQSDGKHICVGLDPDRQLIGAHTQSAESEIKIPLAGPAGVFNFNRTIIRATCDIAAAYKLNPAFYLSLGRSGTDALYSTVDCIRVEAPGVPIILDGKYGDVEHSNEHYAHFAFDEIGADAVTVNPLFGLDHLMPFLDYEDKGIYVLCRNSGSLAHGLPTRSVIVHYQDGEKWKLYHTVGVETWATANGEVKVTRRPYFGQLPLAEFIARDVASDWNGNDNCGLVVGAAHRQEIELAAELSLPLLIPGFGAQGESLHLAVKAAGEGDFLLSSSRDIIFAGYGKDVGPAARDRVAAMQQQIDQVLYGIWGW